MAVDLERIRKGRAELAAKEARAQAEADEKKAAKAAQADRFLTGSTSSGTADQLADARRRKAEADAVVSGAAAEREAAKASREPGTAVATDAGPEGVSTGMRRRGSAAAREGLSLFSEADRKVSYKVANKNYGSVKGYTDAMQGEAPVGRQGLFKRGSAAAREGLASLSKAPQDGATPPAATAPVQVVIQQPGAPQPAAAAPQSSGRALPAGAAPGTVPGQAPTPAPAEAAPLEGEPPVDETPEQELARLEAAAAGMTPEELEAQAAADYGDGGELEGDAGMPEPRAGILQRQMDAEEEAANARVGMAQAEADAMASASEQYQGALSDAEAAKAEQDAKVAYQLEASEEATRLVERTTKEAIEASAIDPKRAWATMGIGRKIAFTLSEIAFGVAGNSNPSMYLDRYIEQDIEQQREAGAKAQANVGTAREAAAERGNLYQRTLAAVGDERVAADVVRVARIDQITADLKAKLSAAGVTQMSAEQEAMLTKLEEDKAAAQMRIQSQAANNPQMFTKTAFVHGAGARAGMKLLGKEMIKDGVGASERADKQEGDLEIADYKAKAKAAAAAAEQSSGLTKEMKAQVYNFGKDTATAQVVIDQIDQILALDDIPGYGYTEGVGTPGKMDTDAQIMTTLEALGRLQSQGAITDDELVNFRRMVMEGVTLGDGSIFENSETRLRKNLKNVKNMVGLKVKAIERGMDPEARDFYNRTAAGVGADFNTRWTGGGDESVVEED